jgi:hypothetical protein
MSEIVFVLGVFLVIGILGIIISRLERINRQLEVISKLLMRREGVKLDD